MSQVVTFNFDGVSYSGSFGQSIAAALFASGVKTLSSTRFGNQPRSIFCGIGICFDCVVVVDGVSNQRACLIEISEGMEIKSTS